MPLHWEPVGPLPAATYWRRRAGVAVALVAVVLLVWLLWPSGGSAQDRLKAGPTRSASPTVTATATASPTAGSGSSASSSAPPCLNEAVAVDATTDTQTYRPGSTAVITVSVKNTGTTPCARHLESGAVEAVITSGADRIWSSSDCGKAADLSDVVLTPGTAKTVTLKWPGTRSAPGCPSGLPAPQPGTYRVTARVGDLSVPGPAFQVTG